ncbi:PP2C family protein-serine/threonine phosphatase [Celeribacter sp.]|uniref:PP2C family protein-serine/threonine phosphatase n=1 Tax=Celeribacter sp. TaxID=1890673 RepID=UPI003A8F70F8
MSLAQTNSPDTVAAPERGVVDRVLVVDDSAAQRKILGSHLQRWGYRVLKAASGREAIEVCAHEDVDLVISDWMMPEVTGLDFLRHFRTMERQHYGYFILLTSKSEKADIAEGLDVGADDFLTKPVSGDELLARIRAGERILRMERELTEKNRLVSETLQQISDLYESLDRDLVEARRLQQSLIRERHREFPSASVSLMLKPSGHVGGDLVGFYPINADTVGVFSLDVSGHGVASALMTARLAAYLSGASPDQNLAIEFDETGAPIPRSPARVAAKLNTVMLQEMETDLYFTMALGHIDLKSGQMVMTQCGHPHPLVQRIDGHVEFVGNGGLPIGLLPDAQYEEVTVPLNAGDRVLFYSDGVTECENARGEMLGEQGLMALAGKLGEQRGNAFLDTLLWDLTTFADDRDFGDDVSGLLLEFVPQEPCDEGPITLIRQ